MTREEAIIDIRDNIKPVVGGKSLDMAIEALEQEPKIGYWIDTGSGQMCSECGEIQYGYDSFRRFCASCGIRMVEAQESDGKKNDET